MNFAVALTSIPPRFAQLGPLLETILAQRPGALFLTFPRRYLRFPDWDGVLPELPAGVTVLRSDDFGPATKFTAALGRAGGGDLLIADDDCDYGMGWLAAFARARPAHPGAVLAASTFDAARLGVDGGHLVVQGFAGVLLSTAALPEGTARPDPRSMWVDDIWLSAQAARAGIGIVSCPDARHHVRPGRAAAPLQEAEIAGQRRGALNRQVAQALARRYGIWGSGPTPESLRGGVTG